MNQQARSAIVPSNRTAGAAPGVGLRGARGSGASAIPRASKPFIILALSALAIVAFLALTVAPASAAILHPYQSQITEAGGSNLGSPQGLAVDSAGNLYLADASKKALDKFDSSGAPVTAWGTNGQITEVNGAALNEPFGLAVDGSDSLWASDLINGALYKLAPSGSFELQGEGPEEGGKFPHSGNYIQGLAYGTAANRLYVADSNEDGLHLVGPTGAFIETLAGPWGVGCCFIRDAADNSGGSTGGDIYVSGAEEGNAIYRIDATGTAAPFSESAPYIEGAKLTGTPAGPFPRQPGAVAVDSAGHLYAAVENVVYEYEPSGKFLGEIAGTPTGTGSALVPFGEVRAIGVASSTGRLYVADAAKHAVAVFAAAGVLLPDASTEAASEVANTTAKLNGTINPLGTEASYQFEYGTTKAYGQKAPASPAAVGNDNTDHEVTTELSGLAPSTTYHFRLDGINPEGTNRGLDQSFRTTGPATIDSTQTSGITRTAATIESQINPSGYDTHTWIEYGTTPAYGSETAHADLGSSSENQATSATLEGLTAQTTFHFRVLAENECEPIANPGHICLIEGPDRTFETLPPVAIDSTSVSNVTATSATLETELNPGGLATTYHFEYDTSPYTRGEAPHGTAVPFPDASAGSGEANVFRSAQIQGLQPETTYHFRVVAENSLGISFGPDLVFSTQGAAASLLPDGRVWEMVTPPNKHGSPLEPITEESGIVQAATDGSAFAEVALGPLGPEAHGVNSPANNQWLSDRGPAGWATQDITTPNENVAIIRAGYPSEYKFFAADLSASAVEPDGNMPLSPLTTERTPYRRDSAGEFEPLVTAENVPPQTKFAGKVQFLTASPDLGHILLASNQILAPGFEPGFEPGERNFYELAGGRLTLVSVLPSPDGRPTAEAGLSAAVGWKAKDLRGAISTDGGRVTFEAGSTSFGNHLYLRDVPLAQTLQLDEVQPEAAGGPGAAEFQAANSDASKVFFTDASRLTQDSTAKPGEPDLYVCKVKVEAGHLACAISDLSVSAKPGEAANVQGRVSAIDSAGTHIYFAANGVLTSIANMRGELAVPGNCSPSPVEEELGPYPCNLYVADTTSGQVSLVAVLSSNDDPVWAGTTSTHTLGSLTARSSSDGRYFTFMSTRSLTGYDNRDARSGQRDTEVFQLNMQSGALSCVSCNPTSARPQGLFDEEIPGLLVDQPKSWGDRWLAGSIPGWTLGPSINVALYQSRYLSNSGREFFNAADALVPQDTNGVMDVYEYEPPGVGDCATSSSTYSPTSGGCVSLISSGTSAEESAFLDASESGDDVFFLTQAKLVPSDVDNAFDVYDASVGGKTYETVKPVECSGDACQQPASPPNKRTPGSLSFNGAGNVLQCPKGKVKKSGKCVKQKAKKKHHKKKGHRKHKRANDNRRAGR